MVRAGPLVALLVLGLLFVAASWVDAGMAAAPDPDPSAKKSAPAPDPYQAPASEPESSPVTETVTQPVTQPVTHVETAPSTGSATRTPAEPTRTSKPATRTQKKTKPEAVATPKQTRQTAPVRIDVVTTDGRPLLLGGLAMVVLALASGSMLFLVTRSGAGLGRWETKP